MAEPSRWFILESDPEPIALQEQDVWRVEPDPVLRPLPRVQPWCVGWCLVKEHAVPVLGWSGCSREGGASALVVVRSQDHLLGLPCSGVQLVQGACEDTGEPEGRYPSQGKLVMENGGLAVAVDLQRLFLALGIIERTGYTR